MILPVSKNPHPAGEAPVSYVLVFRRAFSALKNHGRLSVSLSLLCAFFLLSLLPFTSLRAQVTTSGISGYVIDAREHPVIGGVVTVLHVTSGSEYNAVTDAKGAYHIMNVRPGGPYRVTVSMLGYKSFLAENIQIPLGDNYLLHARLEDQVYDIASVVVTAAQNSIFNTARTGTLTHINARELAILPSISRGVSDFIRLTPQAGSDNSFAGRDGRYNNLTIDGASFNNRFGLSSALPGGAAQPISLDAIQELTVSISPFDIRQSSFTGANINAVTRGGDNTFRGSVYTYLRPRSFTGYRVNGVKIAEAEQKESQNYGLTFSGPLVKNKLFFFVTGEIEQKTTTGISWTPTQSDEPVGTGSGNAGSFRSRVTTYDLERVSNHLKTKYGYDPGVYENIPPFDTRNYKFVTRLDWNIKPNHKAMIRYNHVDSGNDVIVNQASRPSDLPLLGANRFSTDAFSFGNSNYRVKDRVQSITGELNSRFSQRVSNKLMVSYTYLETSRTSKSDPFPFVDIWEGGRQYMSFGYELFSFNNIIKNSTFQIINNTTISLGNHTLVAGVSYEYQHFLNSYQREALSYYRYASVDDFLNDRTPTGFAITYPYEGDRSPGVKLSYGQFGFYVQDEWSVTKKLKLTGGMRLEISNCLNSLGQGSAIDRQPDAVPVTQLPFDGGRYYDMGRWPKTLVSFSPRVGFNWDIQGDRSWQLRGGTGLFSGYVPFVWYTNQPGSSGFVQSPEVSLPGASLPAGFHFLPDYREVINNPAYANFFPKDKGLLPLNSALNKVDDDFKLPQVWRTSVATDIKLPGSLTLTLEGLYSKDVHAATQVNANLPSQTTGRFNGADNREVWWGAADDSWNNSSLAARKVQSDVSNFMVLTNHNRGHQWFFTVQLARKTASGFSGNIAYTFNRSRDCGGNPGSAAASAWSSNVSAGSLNRPELGYSIYSTPHRVNGYISYSKTFLKHLTSTFSLYYNGSSPQRVSYIYTNDLNGDGNSSDLLYVPASPDEIRFVNQAGYTAEQQSADFFAYIDGNSYLKNRKGKYAERAGGTAPWLNCFDFKFVQDVFTNFGTDTRYTLQFTVDILNVGNMLCSSWGVPRTMSQLDYTNAKVLTYKGVDSDKTPLFTVNGTSSQDFKDNLTWVPNESVASTWGCMIGFRLKF